MAIVNVYLMFDGNCEEAFTFYHSVFGGDLPQFSRFKDMPQEDAVKSEATEADSDKIMHVTLPISAETSLMGSDCGEAWSPHFKQGNNFSISIDAGSKAEADAFFNHLAQGGAATMPMSQAFWGSYFGMCTDQFGVNWMISFDEKPAQ